MDLNFGHGFIPRIASQNYKAVDRCLGPDTLLDAPLDLPWAIVDAPWAEKNQNFLASLRAHGTKVLLDGSCWRYRYGPTFDVGTMAKASWAPPGPLTADAPEQLARFVRGSLRAQAKLGASAYLVPGFMPDDKQEDLRGAYETIVTAVGEFDEVPPKPLLLFVGAHSEGLAAAQALLDALPSFLSGLYLQVAPTAPVTDSPTKLQRITELYVYAKSLGLAVIGGHAGAITPALRACGIDAADAGLASGETFESSSARRPKPPRDPETQRNGGPSSRMYLEALGRSFDAKRVTELRSVAAVRDLLGSCRLPCHRFVGGDDFLARAKEHTLRARVADAKAISALPSTMRLTEMIQLVIRRRSTVTAVNTALKQAEIGPIDTRAVDNHLNWLGRLTESHSAA